MDNYLVVLLSQKAGKVNSAVRTLHFQELYCYPSEMIKESLFSLSSRQATRLGCSENESSSVTLHKMQSNLDPSEMLTSRQNNNDIRFF